MYNRFFYCPNCINQDICPFSNNQMRSVEDFDEFENFEPFYEEDELETVPSFYEEYEFDNFRAPQQEVTRILSLLNTQQPQLNRSFQPIVDNYFRNVINYTLDNERRHSGNINARTNAIFNDFRRNNESIFSALRSAGIPNNVINSTIRDIIEFVLRNIGRPPSPGPGPGPAPGDRWSQWEDLGGVLNSAPGVSSWAPNRLDVFAAGSDNALYHKWWNGSRWSDWENLGGTLTSAPAAVSWGNNRIDVFARGERNRLYHKWWDGSRWSNWEDLGGNLTSAPAVSSRATNRLEVFARGQNNQLMTMSWNGSRWSNWSNLGGRITSDPAAVSWGPSRTDVFARGTNNALWHIWRS